MRSGTAWGVSDSLWVHSAPGQILVSGTLYETLQFTPGLRFRPVSADPLSPDDAYQELLWTDAETLAEWQDRVGTASHQLAMEGSHPQPEIGAADAEPFEAGFLAGPSGAREEEDELQISTDGSRRTNRVWFAAGAVCLALIAAIGIFVHLNAGRAHEVRPQSPKPLAVEPKPIPHPDNSTVPGNGLVKQPGTATEVSKPAYTRVPPAGRKAARETEAPVKEYEGFTSKQIPQLLHKAEEDAGAGNYDDAKREYAIVRKLQPGNPAAQEGLRKLALKTGGRQ